MTFRDHKIKGTHASLPIRNCEMLLFIFKVDYKFSSKIRSDHDIF